MAIINMLPQPEDTKLNSNCQLYVNIRWYAHYSNSEGYYYADVPNAYPGLLVGGGISDYRFCDSLTAGKNYALFIRGDCALVNPRNIYYDTDYNTYKEICRLKRGHYYVISYTKRSSYLDWVIKDFGQNIPTTTSTDYTTTNVTITPLDATYGGYMRFIPV